MQKKIILNKFNGMKLDDQIRCAEQWLEGINLGLETVSTIHLKLLKLRQKLTEEQIKKQII